MAQNRLKKLELTWIGKDDDREAIEPRILIEDPHYSFGESDSGNMLIHGDNLLALKALEQEYSGKVKCIYIDPPYNTGHAFEHYDDGLEHSIWLNLMRERLELLHKLLAKDGSIWISIDDDEQAYLKVLMDEVFGRRNFVNNVIWEKKFSPSNDAKWLSDSHDFIMVYAKNKDIWRPNLLPRSEEMDSRYKNPDNDHRGTWTSGDLLRKDEQKSGLYTIVTPSGKICNPPSGRSWRVPEYKYKILLEDNRIWFGVNGDGVPRIKRFLSDVKSGITSMTIWKHIEVGHNQEAQKEVRLFNNDNPFSTPKPERLIERIMTLATNKGDLVLDSFLGSGTTAAVAHKMGRRWIGVELGEHAKTHCYPRMKMVAEGADQGGISKAQSWKGGGGFRFYSLAPSLLNEDQYGNLIINKGYNADMLAAAMAKHEGFRYSPDKECYWKQGRSSEADYIYTTTQFLTVAVLESIKEQMKEDETLVVCCKSFEQGCNKIAGISIRKIPQSLLGRCEFNADGYPLNIIDLPIVDDEEYCDEDVDESEYYEPPMHDDLVALERSWDNQERIEIQQNEVNKTLFD